MLCITKKVIIMSINKATEYSIRALIYMAMNANTQIISKEEICKTQGVTHGFLTKIMQPLIKAGIVKSFRGAKGGFQLAKNPKEITLYEVIKAIDNLLCLNECLLAQGSCKRRELCFMHFIWVEAKDSIQDVFKKYTLYDIARKQINLFSSNIN